MVFESTEYIEPELEHLKQAHDWSGRWSQAIVEVEAGHPSPFRSYPLSSGNLIHHAYHLCRFEQTTGTSVDSFDLIFEFGGGYGSLCRLFHNLGFTGHYVIFDLPEFSYLQKFFLKLVGLPVQTAELSASDKPGICTLSDLAELKKLLPALNKRAQRSLFVATWSLSEASVEFRQQILELASPFDAWLLAYQSRFGEVNNESYFAELAAQKREFRWRHLPIEHIPKQFYLIGERETAFSDTAAVKESRVSAPAQPENRPLARSKDGGSTKSTPSVFVVIPTHNRWEEARVTLGCLLNSTYKDFRILLVEDACTDGTVEKCRAEFPQVEILHGDGNLWWSGSTNMGTKRALEQGAEIVMWINDDIRVEPETVAHLVESFERKGEKSIVCARIRLPAGEQEWRGDPPSWHPAVKEWKPLELPTTGDLAIEHPPGGQGVLIPARCFREIGFLDRDNFAMNWADHNFHYRAMKAGYKYFISPRAVVWERANKEPPQAKNIFTMKGAWWFLTNRRSYGNLKALRRHLKRCLAPAEYRRIFYPILFRHLVWLSYEWLARKPLLYRPLHALKKFLSRDEPHSLAG
jgi:GT2 family glycosyltransferase